jgi:hypothetical protein
MAVSLALCLPALKADFFTDDHVLLAEIEGRLPGVRAWDLYSFCPDAAALKRTLDAGAYPWWTNPEVRLRLFRPLPSLLMSAEHAAFGRRALGYHLVTLAVFAAMLLAASRVLRAALPGAPALAGVAFAVFAWNDLQAQPAMWLADRHAVLAALFGFLGVWLHVRRREQGGSWGGAASLGASAVGLLCSEVGLQPLAYVLAYEALRRRKPGPVLPAAALAVGYLVAYRALGYGTQGSGIYLDPGSDPAGFLLALPSRLLAFAADLLAGAPLDLWLFSPLIRPVLIGGGLLALALFGWALWRVGPLDESSSGVRWLLAGAVMAAVAATPGAPGSRLLLVPGLGVAAGLAALVLRLPGRSRAWGALGVVVVVVHLVLQPIQLLVQVLTIDFVGRRAEAIAWAAPVPEREGVDVGLIGVEDPQVGIYAGLQRLLSDRRPRSWRLLTGAGCEHQLTPVGRDALDVKLVGCRLMETEWERLFNARPFAAGDTFQLSGLKVEVTGVAEGAPTRLRFTFARALDDPDLVLLTWRNGAFRRIELPPGGATVVLRP